MASRYFNLVQTEQTSAKNRAKVARGLISTLDVYESFHLITRQQGWAAEDERVKLSEEEEEEEKEKEDKPTFKWCCKWTVCEHTALVASVFSPKYEVPGKLIAATPALRGRLHFFSEKSRFSENF